MRVEVVKPFGTFSKGAVIPSMPAGQARGLITRGLVRELSDTPAKEFRAPVNRMVTASPQRKGHR